MNQCRDITLRCHCLFGEDARMERFHTAVRPPGDVFGAVLGEAGAVERMSPQLLGTQIGLNSSQ